MTTPSLLQIDDRDPLIFYSPNTSWTRGGAPSDFDGTSTFTNTPGSSATLTFTGNAIYSIPLAFYFNIFRLIDLPIGTGISVWGTIQLLQPNEPTFVVSTYIIDRGRVNTFNATEKAGYQFQQKLFQSAPLNDTAPHTIVVTLINNGTLFIDYFLIIPAGSSTTSTSSSEANTSSLAGPTTSAGADSQSSSRVTLGAALGGSLGGLALLIIAVLAFLLCWKRRKTKNPRE